MWHSISVCNISSLASRQPTLYPRSVPFNLPCPDTEQSAADEAGLCQSRLPRLYELLNTNRQPSASHEVTTAVRAASHFGTAYVATAAEAGQGSLEPVGALIPCPPLSLSPLPSLLFGVFLDSTLRYTPFPGVSLDACFVAGNGERLNGEHLSSFPFFPPLSLSLSLYIYIYFSLSLSLIFLFFSLPFLSCLGVPGCFRHSCEHHRFFSFSFLFPFFFSPPLLLRAQRALQSLQTS